MTAARRIFVVEDESLVLFHLEDILADLGVTVLGPAMRLPQALKVVETLDAPDAAILDVNLGGEPVFPVAEALARRGVPIIFATGYGRDGLPEQWRDRPVLTKPYSARSVAETLVLVAEAETQPTG